ncbi:DUF417 family protein [Mycolicibacterium sp. CH28]|uniref:YkgB family protein n=1 Tax=Mycolicibacterium sp. CH28 TaxID=2512237 RepID=UPI001080C622|nr:DUF417 family protein [Mycolicibacterium sp. CH28]TGD84414.1 DUF417 family protein [Mycolicibacterium sp. CH28]
MVITGSLRGPSGTSSIGLRLSRYGGWIVRYGLVIPILWIGLAKFTDAEARAIMPLVANQPAMGWLYGVVSVQAVSNGIGVIEVLAAILIAVKSLAPRLSATGSGIAVALFLSTVSFLFTTPDVVDAAGVIPMLTDTGGFLIKDIALLGAAVWTLGDALQASASRRPDRGRGVVSAERLAPVQDSRPEAC